jgi:hypothetical protein
MFKAPCPVIYSSSVKGLQLGEDMKLRKRHIIIAPGLVLLAMIGLSPATQRKTTGTAG